MSKKRGGLLTFVIVLLGVGYLKYLYLPFNPQLIEHIFGFVPNWFWLWSLLALVIGIPVVVGLWFWRKWAIYLFGFTAIVGFVMDNIVFRLPLWAHLGYYSTLFLAIWAIFRKRECFS